MLRKSIAILLLLSMVVLASCAPSAAPSESAAPAGGDEAAAPADQEVVTLHYYWIGNGDTDQRANVEAAINEYIEPLIGANVVFHIVGWGDWETKAVTALQAGEPMDIMFTADWRNYMQLATQGLYLPLNDDDGPVGNLLAEHGQDILSSLNPAFITGTQIDGVNYAVPVNKELTVPEGFIYNVAAADEIGFTEEDAANIKTLADLEPWLAKAKEARPDEYPYLTDGRIAFQPWVPEFAAGVQDNILSMKEIPDADGNFDDNIYSILETDWAKEYTAVMRDWYEKGYINPDAGLLTFLPAETRNAGKYFIEPQPLKGYNIKAQELVNASGNPDLELKEIYAQPKINITVHSGGSMLAIPALSEYPVQAMEFINLMHSDPKLVNMMLYGVEGTNWEYEDDGRVNLIDSAWYGAHGGAWTVGDVTLQAVTNKEDPDKNRLLIEYANDSIDHPSLGFRFRQDPVIAEMTAIKAVAEGTVRAVMTGYADPETALPKLVEDLKAAGLDNVKAELETQYAAWEQTKSE